MDDLACDRAIYTQVDSASGGPHSEMVNGEVCTGYTYFSQPVSHNRHAQQLLLDNTA